MLVKEMSDNGTRGSTNGGNVRNRNPPGAHLGTNRYSGKELLRKVPEEMVRIVIRVWFDCAAVALGVLGGRPGEGVLVGRISATGFQRMVRPRRRWRPEHTGRLPAPAAGYFPGGHGSQ